MACASPSVRASIFQHCMHGGDRDKTTRFAHNIPAFAELEIMCSGDHSHKPWGAYYKNGKWQFSTAEEAQYP
eukprot:4674920-Karenia_brevis.AAC.1